MPGDDLRFDVQHVAAEAGDLLLFVADAKRTPEALQRLRRRDVLRQPSALRDEALKPHRLTEQERQRMREQLRKPNPLNETGKP